MSDAPQGEGWWVASDGKWYPPELHPDYATQAQQAAEPPLTQPLPQQPPAQPPTQAWPAPPGGTVPPTGPVPPGGTAPPVGGGPEKPNRTPWIIGGVAAGVVLLLLALYLISRDDNNDNVATASSSSRTTQSSTRRSSSSSRGSLSSRSSASASSSPPGNPALQSKMLTPSDLGQGFEDSTFSRDTNPMTPCGTQSPDTQFPPQQVVGAAAIDQSVPLFFQEELDVYPDDATATKAFNASVQGSSCTEGTIVDSDSTESAQFSPPRDVSADLGVDHAVRIDAVAESLQGTVIEVKQGSQVVSFLYETTIGTDTTSAPDPIDVTKKGLQKLNG